MRLGYERTPLKGPPFSQVVGFFKSYDYNGKNKRQTIYIPYFNTFSTVSVTKEKNAA
jgi:hypothetical protein